MDYQKLFQKDITTDSVKAWKAQGKKALGVLCCHVPVEIFYALDIMPVRLRATGVDESPDGDAWMSQFSCSYARGILQHWMTGTYADLDGIIATDGCMMPTRMFDNAKYQDGENHGGKPEKLYFQFGAPRLAGDIELEFYMHELKDLIEVLENFSGNKLTDEKLIAAIAKENEVRTLIQQVYDLRKADKPVVSGEEMLKLTMAASNTQVDEYIELLKAFLADAKNRKPVEGRVRLMVIGSALDDPEYMHIIEDKGGLVVHDALCYGSRPFNNIMEIDEKLPLESIAKYYLTRLACPRMLDNRVQLQKWIVDTCKEWNIEGVVYEKMQYCECWGGESMYLEPDLKAVGIPMLILQREEHISNAGQLAIRAEAFVEMIEASK